MGIPRDMVISILREQGEHRRAEQAEIELPADIDPDLDERLLRRFGLRPSHVDLRSSGRALAGR